MIDFIKPVNLILLIKKLAMSLALLFLSLYALYIYIYISFSNIQITSSYFHQHTASTYHQKAGEDRTTHAYTNDCVKVFAKAKFN